MEVVLIILALSCVITPLVVGRKYGILPYVSPLYFVSYFAFFGILLKTISYLIAPELVFFRNYIRDDSAVMWGYLYVTLFVFAICVGYRFGIRRVEFLRSADFAKISVLSILKRKSLFLFSVTAFVLVAISFLSHRGFSGLSDAFSLTTLHILNSQKLSQIEGVEGYGSSFAAIRPLFIINTLAFVVFYSIQRVRPSVRNGAYTYFTLFICVLATLLLGQRIELVSLIIYVLCINIMLGRKVNISMIAGLVAAFSLVLVVFVFMTTLRSAKGDIYDSDLLISASLSQILNSTYFLDVNMSILIVELSDPESRFYGESYLWWLFGWIPREIWPTKPALTLGPYIKQYVLGIYGGVGGINPTGPGEAFLNFAWFGIFVGAALGFAYRKIEEFMLSTKMVLNGGSVWLYPLLFFPFIQTTLQSSFSAFIVSVTVEFIIIWIILRYVKANINKGTLALLGSPLR